MSLSKPLRETASERREGAAPTPPASPASPAAGEGVLRFLRKLLSVAPAKSQERSSASLGALFHFLEAKNTLALPRQPLRAQGSRQWER